MGTHVPHVNNQYGRTIVEYFSGFVLFLAGVQNGGSGLPALVDFEKEDLV